MMTERSVKLLVWGLLFLLIDIRFFTFDIVHDLIGYLLLFKGMNHMKNSRWLSYAKASAFILIFFSILETFGVSYFDLNEVNQDITLDLLLAGITSLISLFFHLNLLSALLDNTFESIPEESYKSLTRFKSFYFIVNLIIILTLPLILIFRDMFAMYLVVILIAGLIVEITYIVKVNSFKRYTPAEEHTS